MATQTTCGICGQAFGCNCVQAGFMLASIKAGDRVTIRVPAGIWARYGKEWKEATGRAVMSSRDGCGSWALNMGGKHGTPGVATRRNIVRVRYGRA